MNLLKKIIKLQIKRPSVLSLPSLDLAKGGWIGTLAVLFGTGRMSSLVGK